MSLVTWAYRLIVLAAIAFILSTYGRTSPQTNPQTSSGAGSQTSYADELQQALAGLKELARALQ
jgi:hypothetical protein